MDPWNASLHMYWFAETSAAIARFQRRICTGFAGSMDWQTPDAPDYANPRLGLAQTCWGPIEKGELPNLRVLGQMDYSDVPGGKGAYYRSALIRRGNGPDVTPDGSNTPDLSGRFAYNDATSLSGFLGLRQEQGWPAPPRGSIATGSHQASLAAVARGDADFAAIDCMTLDHLRRFDPNASCVRIVGWTAPRLGLPFVCSAEMPNELVHNLMTVLQANGVLAPVRDFPAQL